jgi:predicted porin
MQNSQSSIGVERSDLEAYDLGATFSYFGFNFGASYGSWGKSMQPKNGIYSCDYNSSETLLLQTCATNVRKFQDPHYYTAGIAYAFGPIAASITGIKSKFQENSYEAISLGVDYKLSRALMPYVEITKFAFKSNQPKSSDIINQYAITSNQRQIKNNQGYILLTGISISF